VLVDAAAARAVAPLTGLARDGAALEWSARLLRRRAGYLAPASVADTDRTAVADPIEEARMAAAMLAGRGWAAREKLWLAGESLGRSRSSLGRRPGALVRAAGAGALSARAAGADRRGRRARRS
jgi:hypothetical protein